MSGNIFLKKIGGAGDVAGPASAVDEDIAVFDSTTGKLIKDSGVNISEVVANTLKVTNATHTGEVTGDTTLTIADNIIDEANLKLDETPTNDYVLTADSTKTGGMKWAEAAGGVTIGDTITDGTDESVLFLGVAGVLAQDNANFSYDDATTTLTIQNIQINGTFSNYNSALPDIGKEQTSDLRGYGDDYVTDKRLVNCPISLDGDEVTGTLRNNSGTMQVYLNGAWEDIVTNFRFREDTTLGTYELEHKPIGFEWWIEIASGNSHQVAINGLPFIQNYAGDMGGVPRPVIINGGTF